MNREISVNAHPIEKILFSIFLLLSNFYLMSNLIGLIVLLMVLFKTPLGIGNNRGLQWRIIFFVFCIISLFWADLGNAEIGDILTIICGLISSIFVSVWFSGKIGKQEDVVTLLKLFIFAFTVAFLYVILKTPTSELFSANKDFYAGINRNALGIQLAWGCVFAYFMAKYLGYSKKYYIWALVFLLFSLLTGSRKVILVVALSIAGFKLIVDGNKKIIINVISVLALFFLAYYVLMRVDFFYASIGNRVEALILSLFSDQGADVDASIFIRTKFKHDAIELFKQMPILGHGISGFMTNQIVNHAFFVAYSHCNYTELLANFGVVGFGIYYIPKIIFLIQLIRIRLFEKNPIVSLGIIIAVIALILDYGYVSYYTVYGQMPYLVSYYILYVFNRKFYSSKSMRVAGIGFIKLYAKNSTWKRLGTMRIVRIFVQHAKIPKKSR